MWEIENESLVKRFVFRNFVEAWGFMAKVALLAERMNHHPDWSNSYNKVEIRLCTHDAGNKVTEKDKALSVAIDKIYGHT